LILKHKYTSLNKISEAIIFLESGVCETQYCREAVKMYDNASVLVRSEVHWLLFYIVVNIKISIINNNIEARHRNARHAGMFAVF